MKNNQRKIGENQSKIKVVHIITKLELGGAQLNTIFTWEHLDKERFIVYLLTGQGGILTEKLMGNPMLILIDDLVREIRLIKDIKAYWQIRRVLKSLQPHIVHTHSSKAGIIGRLAAFFFRVPVIIHSVHGFPFSPYQSKGKRIFYQWMERVISYLTDHYVFVAKSDLTTALRLRLTGKGHSIIRSGFPLQKFKIRHPDTAKIRQQYFIPPRVFVCGVIAPFKQQKGLLHLLEIASLVLKERDDIIFFLAGDGELRQPLVKVIKRKNMEANFRLPGFILDIDQVMDIFDVGVSTALWEGLPQSLVQMRLKKIPVVASDIPGNREIIYNNVNGLLVDVFDYQTFAQKIVFLLNDKSWHDKLAQYDDDFSHWEAQEMVKKQEHLYLTLRHKLGAR